MDSLRRLTATWRGRAILTGSLLVVVLLVAGAVSAVREAQSGDVPASTITPVTELVPSLAQQPEPRWRVPERAPTEVWAPAGGNDAYALYTVAPAADADGALEVLRADTGEHLRTIGLEAPVADSACLVNGHRAACSVGAEVVFADLDAGTVTGRATAAGTMTGYPVGDGFLLWSAGAAPARYGTDGSVHWRARGDEFNASVAAPVVYAFERSDDGEGTGRVLAADDGAELVQIAVKEGQSVRFQSYPGGFALERPGQQIRFFDARGEALPGAVSAEGGQRLAATAGDGRAAPPIPVILEGRREHITVVGVDPVQQSNLWKQELPQTDTGAVRVYGVGTQVVVDGGDGHCFAFDAATGSGGAIGCAAVLGTDGERLVQPVGSGDLGGEPGLAGYRPGAAQPLWEMAAQGPRVFGGGLYTAGGRLG